MADVTALRFAQAFRRALGIKTTDVGRVFAHGIQSVFPTVDAYAPELRSERGERSWGFYTFNSNTAATNFGQVQIGQLATSGRIAVIQRMTWSVLLPTSTNQPGNTYIIVEGPRTATAVPGANFVVKDSRAITTGAIIPTAVTSVYLTQQTKGVAIITSLPALAARMEQLFPGAAVTPTRVQWDNLDIVIQPGTAVIAYLGADTLPVATYNWGCMVEGYEYTADSAEFLAAVP